MPISSATKSLAEAIETSHETRVTSVSDLVKETHQMLENFQREHREMADALRNELLSSERDRRQEFATFQRNLRDEITTRIADITADHKQARAEWESLNRTKAAKRD
jgi:predicted DNA-binding protein YlxM (UPF0122 family)